MTSLLCNYYVMCALYTLAHTRMSDSQSIASIFHTQIKPTMLAIFKGKISYPQMYNNGPSVITLVISLLANARLAQWRVIILGAFPFLDVQCQAIAFKTEDQASACVHARRDWYSTTFYFQQQNFNCLCIVYRQIGLCITKKNGLFLDNLHRTRLWKTHGYSGLDEVF